MTNKQTNQINLMDYYKWRIGEGYQIGKDDRKALSDYAKSKNLTIKKLKNIFSNNSY